MLLQTRPRQSSTFCASLLLACWQSRHKWRQHILPVTPTPPCTAAITDQLHINTLAGWLHLGNNTCSRVLCTRHTARHSTLVSNCQASATKEDQPPCSM